jgi:hypothetical protein
VIVGLDIRPSPRFGGLGVPRLYEVPVRAAAILVSSSPPFVVAYELAERVFIKPGEVIFQLLVVTCPPGVNPVP